MVCVASLLVMQLQGERATNGWLVIRIMCPSGVTSLKWNTKNKPHSRNKSKINFKNLWNRGNIDTPYTHLHDRSHIYMTAHTFTWPLTFLAWYGNVVVFNGPREMMQSCKCFPHVSKIPTLIHNWLSSGVIKNARILNFVQNILNLRDTEVVI